MIGFSTKIILKFLKKTASVPTFFVLLSLCLGCASLNPHKNFSSKKGSLAAPTSQLASILFNQNSDLGVEDVLSGNKNLLVKFSFTAQESDAKQYFYARALLDFHKTNGKYLTKNYSVPLEFVSEEEWTRKVEGKEPVQFLDSYQWPLLKESLAKDLLPQEPNQGIRITFSEEPFILFYNDSGQLQFVSLKDAPATVDITKSLDPQEVHTAFFQSLQSFAGQEAETVSQEPEAGSMPAKVLVSLPKNKSNSQPFLFVDLEQKIIASLHFSLPSGKGGQQGLIKNGIKTADYLLLDSNVLGIVSHPFSSVLRLFYWSKNTALDMIVPQKMVTLDPRPVPPLKANRPHMDLQAFEKKLDSLTGTTSAGSMRFLIGGDVFFPRLITAILEAKKSIYVRIFIFDNDDYAVKIADLLKAKSKEKGVEVYVLLDRMGQVMGEGKLPSDLPQGFVPPDSIIDYLQKDSDIHLRVTPSSLLKADHIKTIIIDEAIAFTGGMNIGREYRYDWHDLMMELRGPIIQTILKDFDLAWANAGPLGDLEYILKRNFYRSRKVSSQGHYPIRPLFTRLNHPQIFQAQVLAIKQAKNRIYINNAYFSDDTILRELILARRRGVDVRVILPIANNHEIMNANNVITANILFKNGIEVYFYPGMSHVKAAIYDGWLCAGSANFDRLSFRDNKELNLATSHPPTVETFKRELFDADFAKSRLMQKPFPSGWKNVIAEFLAEQL